MSLFSRLVIKDATATYDKILLEKINKISETAVFCNQFSKGYVSTSELAGFRSIEIRIIGPDEIKTISGVHMKFIAEKDEFNLVSESDTIKTDYSNLSQIGITKFDIDFDPEFFKFLKSNPIQKIVLQTKNGQILKQALTIDFTEVNNKILLRQLS